MSTHSSCPSNTGWPLPSSLSPVRSPSWLLSLPILLRVCCQVPPEDQEMGESPRNASQHPALPLAWCLATRTMLLQGNPIFCPSCPAPRPRCQTLPKQAPLDTATAEPCRCLESHWLPAVPACQQWRGLWVFIAYSHSCLISSRVQALAHVLPGWAQARGGTRGRLGTSAATWTRPSVCGHTCCEDTHGVGSFGSKGCPSRTAGSVP